MEAAARFATIRAAGAYAVLFCPYENYGLKFDQPATAPQAIPSSSNLKTGEVDAVKPVTKRVPTALSSLLAGR